MSPIFGVWYNFEEIAPRNQDNAKCDVEEVLEVQVGDIRWFTSLGQACLWGELKR